VQRRNIVQLTINIIRVKLSRHSTASLLSGE